MRLYVSKAPGPHYCHLPTLQIILLGLINLIVLIESFRLASPQPEPNDGKSTALLLGDENAKFVMNYEHDLVAAASGYGGGKKSSKKAEKYSKKASRTPPFSCLSCSMDTVQCTSS